MSAIPSLEFSVPTVFSPIPQLLDLARGAEEAGFDRIVLPDSLFFPENQQEDYPYTPDGSRMWDENTPWVEPLTASAAMGAVTKTIRFCPQVLKLGPRNPLLLSRQVATTAMLTEDRLDLGVGIGWDPNEFEWCGAPFKGRGKRVDEMLDILRLTLSGEWVEFHGTHFDFERLKFSPPPAKKVPFYVGGHTDVALRRAARIGQGWTSAMMKFDEIVSTIARLDDLLREDGRSLSDRGDGQRFAIQVVCLDRFDEAGYRELAEAGVTDLIVVPWVFEGKDFACPIDDKIAAMNNFSEQYELHS